MLNCKYCDYLKALSNYNAANEETFVCDFTSTIFENDVENLDIDPPCYCLKLHCA
jgi:hypothetical protein